jgi:hypothetical protein
MKTNKEVLEYRKFFNDRTKEEFLKEYNQKKNKIKGHIVIEIIKEYKFIGTLANQIFRR